MRSTEGLTQPEKQPNTKQLDTQEVDEMTDDIRDEYDFTQARSNPYTHRLKKQVTIRLDVDTIDYFKAQATQTGIPYQTLINLYLADCATQERELALTWA